MTQGTVIWSIVLGIISVGMVAFVSYRKGVDDGDIDSISSRLLAEDPARQECRHSSAGAFSLTARLQQVRLTLNLFRLNPATATCPDQLDGSWLHKAARSEIAQLIAGFQQRRPTRIIRGATGRWRVTTRRPCWPPNGRTRWT